MKHSLKYPVLTLGNFDGIHKGHLKIINKVIDLARRNNGTSILYTFEPHPVKILSPELTPPLLQTRDQKIELLKNLGLDKIVIEPFTKEFARRTPENFFRNIIIGKLAASELVIGYDFTFGTGRSGSVEYMEKMADDAGIRFHIVDAVFKNRSLISSTHIRHYLRADDLTSANAMLGRAYSIRGEIIKGHGIGAELGFHTANLKSANEIFPPPGVYISSIIILPEHHNYNSVTNIGYNPTFGGSELSIETHILDFNGSLIKKEVELSFYKKIRREMTFESPEDLRLQIEKDVLEARRYHEKRI